MINSRGPGYHRVVSNSGLFDRDIQTFILGYYPEVHYVSVEIFYDSLYQEIVENVPVSEEISTISDADSPESDHEHAIDIYGEFQDETEDSVKNSDIEELNSLSSEIQNSSIQNAERAPLHQDRKDANECGNKKKILPL